MSDMIPHCCVCQRRHYGALCPDLPHYRINADEHVAMKRALLDSVKIRKRLKP